MSFVLFIVPENVNGELLKESQLCHAIVLYHPPGQSQERHQHHPLTAHTQSKESVKLVSIIIMIVLPLLLPSGTVALKYLCAGTIIAIN